MENQVLSIEQMNHLKELGVDTNGASMAWQAGALGKDRGEWLLYAYGNCDLSRRYVEKTFTLHDMLSLMPKQIDDYTLNWYISDMILRYDRIDCCDRFEVLEDLSFSFNENVTILDVAYNMLCKLAEGGYLNKK